MKRTYEVRDRADKRAIREFLKREGQFLLPMLELVEQTEVAIDEVIQVMPSLPTYVRHRAAKELE